jgi:hypothetical protein
VISRRVIKQQVQYYFQWDTGEKSWSTQELYKLSQPGEYKVVFGGNFLTEHQVSEQMQKLDVGAKSATKKTGKNCTQKKR